MRYWAEGGQWASARLHADPSVLRQIIIDKYPATGQYVRLLLQNNITDVSVSRPTAPSSTPTHALYNEPSNQTALLPIQSKITWKIAYGILKSNDNIDKLIKFLANVDFHLCLEHHN